MNSDALANDNILVPLDKILTDEAAQTRVKPRAGVVREYAAAMKTQLAEGNWQFPPVILFADGETYHLGDGCHRVLAARLAGLTEIAAEVRPGTRRDAILFGISANNTHGLPRTNADKRKAVQILLEDAEWSQWSDREIARRCQVTHKFVSKLRRSASGDGRQIEVRKVERNGTVSR